MMEMRVFSVIDGCVVEVFNEMEMDTFEDINRVIT